MCVQSAYWPTKITSAIKRANVELQQQLLLQTSEVCEIRSGHSSEVPFDSEFICLVRIETLHFIILSASVEQMRTFGMLKVETLFLYIVFYS